MVRAKLVNRMEKGKDQVNLVAAKEVRVTIATTEKARAEGKVQEKEVVSRMEKEKDQVNLVAAKEVTVTIATTEKARAEGKVQEKEINLQKSFLRNPH